MPEHQNPTSLWPCAEDIEYRNLLPELVNKYKIIYLPTPVFAVEQEREETGFPGSGSIKNKSMIRNEDLGLYWFFKGKWSFSRTITTGSIKERYATAAGSGSFEETGAHSNSLIFLERGTISLASGSSLNFSRSYRYDFFPGRVIVFFNDGPDQGKLYQSYLLHPHGLLLQPEEVHLCGKDCYRGAYQLIDDNTFSLTTIVEGAAKDLIIETEFIRNEEHNT